MGTMYVRVKRKRTTVFVHAEPTDTLGRVRERLGAMITVPAANLRLCAPDRPAATVLDENKTLADLRIENDAVLAVVYKQEGTEEWEDVDIEQLPSRAGAVDDAAAKS
eukprot:jgi/Chlat1/2306/Chrsp17S02597